jgi:EmrB/QacA subfamily drug resistance transporter
MATVKFISRTRQYNPWITFAVAAVAQFMVVLDSSITNVALPSIQRGLHFSQSDLQWVVNIYVLVFGGFLLLGGRAGDLFGRRHLFILGLLGFSLASLGGGLAQSAGWLVAARGIQGLGAAIIAPVTLAIVGSTFTEGAERNKAVGIYGALAGVGGAVGVLLGGVLTTDFGWRWVLFVNVPIGLVAAFAAPLLIPPDRLPERRAGFDLLGAATITAGLLALVYGVVKAPENGWTSSTTIGFLAAAAVLTLAFITIELRSSAPLVRLSIFKTRNVTVADVASMLGGSGAFATFYFLSIYMQTIQGYDALEAGVRFLPFALTVIVAAGVTSRLVTRAGYKYVMVSGLAITTAGLFLLSRIRPDSAYGTDVLPAMITIAVGFGMFLLSAQIASVTGVRPSEIGLASGLVNAFQQVGRAVGLAALISISTTELNGVLRAAHTPAAYPTALVDGFQHAFLAGGVLAIAGALLVLFLLPQGGTGAAHAITDQTEDDADQIVA